MSSFTNLEPQVQTGLITAGASLFSALIAAAATIFTVWKTQDNASKNLRASLETQKEQFEISRKEERARFEKEMSEKREDRHFEEKLKVVTDIIIRVEHYGTWDITKTQQQNEAGKPESTPLHISKAKFEILFSQDLSQIVHNLDRIIAEKLQSWGNYQMLAWKVHENTNNGNFEDNNKDLRKMAEFSNQFYKSHKELNDLYTEWLEKVRDSMGF